MSRDISPVIAHFYRLHVETGTVTTATHELRHGEDIERKIESWNKYRTAGGHTWRYAMTRKGILRLREETAASRKAIVTT